MIRSAAPEDLPALAALKSHYITSRYQGFARADVLRKACPDRYLPELTQWLANPLCHIDLVESEKGIESYIVYRRDEQELTGWILEARTRCDRDTVEGNGRLIQRVVLAFRQDGCTMVRAWLLKSNYRLRFLYESLGFRSDGEHRLEERAGETFELVRYVYPL